MTGTGAERAEHDRTTSGDSTIAVPFQYAVPVVGFTIIVRIPISVDFQRRDVFNHFLVCFAQKSS